MANITLPENELWLHTRQQVHERLKQLHNDGYRYVARDEGMSVLVCYNLKPKKHMDLEIWGYSDVQLSNGAKMAYPFNNEDVSEIHWSNKSPVFIEDWLKVNDYEGIKCNEKKTQEKEEK